MPEWRGGSYYAAARRGAKPADANSTAHIGVIYVSRWSSDKVAEEFAKIYASALPGRYNRLTRAEYTGTMPGREKYLSSDGVIFIQHTGDVVIAVESFDESTAEKLIQQTLKKVGADTKAGLGGRNDGQVIEATT
jgi:hypothetical protein